MTIADIGSRADVSVRDDQSHAVGLALSEAGFPVTAVDYRRVPPWSWWRRPRPGALGGIRYPVPVDDVIDVVRQVRNEADASGREDEPQLRRTRRGDGRPLRVP